jgi:transposase-like protein
MVAVAIAWTELAAADLRGAAARARDADTVRRMPALALVLDGHSREDAAAACGMDRQTLRNWAHRYNAEGLASLSDRRPPGRKPHLTPEQRATGNPTEAPSARSPERSVLPAQAKSGANPVRLTRTDALQAQDATPDRPVQAGAAEVR